MPAPAHAVFVLPGLLLLAIAPARAQQVFRQDEDLARHRPEAWAMQYFAGATLMTSAGAAPGLAPGGWHLALDVAHVPSLDDDQRRVGFDGLKQEDLNKSPVFGRLRLGVGLPADWFAELGYTPPVSIDGVRPHGLLALSLGRPLLRSGRFSLSGRAFAQRGEVRGDITCPREVAGVEPGPDNPYGCLAPSRDAATLDLYGIELVPALDAGNMQWHAGIGAVRTELEVQVDALTFDVRDLSRLTTRATVPMWTVGATRSLGPAWQLTAEILHVPLQVRRARDAAREHEPMTSLRLQLRYRHPAR